MFADVLNEYDSMKKEFQLKIKDAMLAEFKGFFEKNPEVKTIQWTQYAPYFNDGDPCNFSVHSVAFSNASADLLTQWGELEDGDDNTLWSWDGYGNVPETVNKHALKELSGLIERDSMEEFLEDAFGSDALVVVTRDGIEVRECSHD